MFVDARDLDVGAVVESDLCIIGAGAAGITLATQLIDSGLGVVVLESGGEQQDAETQGLYIGESSGQPYFDLAIARLRVLGGSTNHWGGTCRPFDPADFGAVPTSDLPGWPIGYSDLEPFYDRAGVICGLERPVTEMDSALADAPTNPLPLDARDFDARYNQIVAKDRRSFSDRYRDDLAAAPDVAVHLWANAVEILVDPARDSVSGVAVATLTGVRYTVHSKVVVLAAGGLENPRVLLSSTGAGANGLGNQHDLVGRCFMEHPRFVAAAIMPTDPGRSFEFYGSHTVGGVRYQGYSSIGTKRRELEEIVDVQLKLSPRFTPAFEAAVASRVGESIDAAADWLQGDDHEGVASDDLMRIAADLTTFGDWFVPGGPAPVPLPGVIVRLLRGTSHEREALIPGLLGDSAGYLWERGISQPPVERVEVTARLAQVPNPASRVRLGDDVDVLGIRRAHLHWELGDADRRSVTRAMEIFGAELAALGIGRTQLLFEPDGPWPPDTRGGFHHMGTTRMSDDPSNGVVDATCRVHGMSNLYVAGSSVFPGAGAGTPTLTLVALALRLADHLADELMP